MNKRYTQISLVAVLALITLTVGFAGWRAQAERGAGFISGLSTQLSTQLKATLLGRKPAGNNAAATFATITVVNTNDSGPGSLRQAILDSNASVGVFDTIEFSGLGANPTIDVLSSLPTITDPVTINGNTGGATHVELNGSGAGASISGLTITAGNSTIAGLVINRFNRYGILIQTTGGNTIKNCYIGTDANGTVDQGNNDTGVRIEAPNNTIGGTSAAERNVISGNNIHGIEIFSVTATGNKVMGNYIGTDVTGAVDLGNTFEGVRLQGAPSNTVGGTNAGEGNLISGNNRHGVVIVTAAATLNKVSGNFIGINAAGNANLGNSEKGVFIADAPNNTIGGTSAAERNVVSGNNVYGVEINGATATGNKVIGNFIGTNAAGTADLGNASDGVFMASAPNNTIGGTTTAERNVISGNDRYGVHIIGTPATGNKVSGNYIGTDANGLADLGNTFEGVAIEDAPNNTVGGMTAGERNVISGNDASGVTIFFFFTAASGNKVIGNYIGTDANGTADLGNTLHGVFIRAPNNTVGGANAGEGNVISGNDGDGVRVVGASSIGNVILGNSLLNNTSLGIDLGQDSAVTPNDAGDGDSGANGLQNFPVLTCATSANGATTISGTLNSLATTAFRIEYFVNDVCDAAGNGEGQTLLGTQNVTTDGIGNVTLNATGLPAVTVGKFITATATRLDAMGDPVETSEFSACLAATAPTLAISDVTMAEGNAVRATLINSTFKQDKARNFVLIVSKLF